MLPPPTGNTTTALSGSQPMGAEEPALRAEAAHGAPMAVPLPRNSWDMSLLQGSHAEPASSAQMIFWPDVSLCFKKGLRKRGVAESSGFTFGERNTFVNFFFAKLDYVLSSVQDLVLCSSDILFSLGQLLNSVFCSLT